MDENGHLASIKFSFLDTTSEELIALERAGPRTLDCRTELFLNNGAMNKIRVFKSDNQITGLAFGYSTGRLVQRVGQSTTDFTEFEFEWNERVVGMYGSETKEAIILIGFILQDVKCTQQLTSYPLYRESAVSGDAADD